MTISGKAGEVLSALGGLRNVVDVEPCISRIRVTVRDQRAVDCRLLRESSKAFVQSGDVVQVILGVETDEITQAIVDAGAQLRSPQ